MKMFLMISASVAVSVFLFWLGVITIGHQSSTAFEIGVLLCVASLFHWMAWPWGSFKAASKGE